jgi:hypothetical protein
MMGTTASFHRHDTWLQLGSERDDSIAPRPPSNDDRPAFVQPNKAAAVLAQVNAKDHYMHGSLLPLLNTGIIHWCRREGRAIHKGGHISRLSVDHAAALQQKFMPVQTGKVAHSALSSQVAKFPTTALFLTFSPCQ